MSDEVRTVNQETGGEKGQKLARFDLIPVQPLTALAEHYGKGARKYANRNWERGYDWSLNYAALMRHVTQWWGGEDVDEETDSHHLVAVAWHAFALLEFALTHPELDDRPTTAPGLMTVEQAFTLAEREEILRLAPKYVNGGTVGEAEALDYPPGDEDNEN